MTLIAGIISRNSNHQVPVSICDSLRQSISRNSSDGISVFKNQSSFFVKSDIGAFGVPAFKSDEDGSITLIAGEPLLSFNDDGKRQDRQKDTDFIHKECANGIFDVFRKAQGMFCAVNYQPSGGTISLIADKLCLRPLYFWINEKYVIFASALRILEGIAEIPKQMDVRALTEMVGLGYPLGDRSLI